MSAPRYIEVNLDGAYEAVLPVPPIGYGITLTADGKPVVALPGPIVDCYGETDERGRHGEACICFGTGTLAIKEPTDIEPVDAADDGLDAMMVALEARDAAKAEQTDPILGASVASLMKREVANRTSSGSGRKTKKIDPKRIAAYDPHPSVEDGRVEKPRGRRPKFTETRRVKIKPTVRRETLAAIAEVKIDLPQVVEDVIVDVEFLAKVQEYRAAQSQAQAA